MRQILDHTPSGTCSLVFQETCSVIAFDTPARYGPTVDVFGTGSDPYRSRVGCAVLTHFLVRLAVPTTNEDLKKSQVSPAKILRHMSQSGFFTRSSCTNVNRSSDHMPGYMGVKYAKIYWQVQPSYIIYSSGLQREHVQIYLMHIITDMVRVHVLVKIPVLSYVHITQIPTDARDASLPNFPRGRG